MSASVALFKSKKRRRRRKGIDQSIEKKRREFNQEVDDIERRPYSESVALDGAVRVTGMKREEGTSGAKGSLKQICIDNDCNDG